MYSNRFKVLEIAQDPTDYDDFEDIAPYNLLDDGKWTSLWMNRHILCIIRLKTDSMLIMTESYYAVNLTK